MGGSEGEEGPPVNDDASDTAGPFEPLPDRPPPSRSYAPDSLTPFTPLQIPELQTDRTARSSVWLWGIMLGIGLVAFVVGVVLTLAALS